MGGETLDSHSVLAKLGYAPLTLEPKEGLALNNGTGASTGVAANACARAFDLTSLALAIHALFAQALMATDQSFQPFVHAVKPHPGQVWTAARMAELLAGSQIIRDERRGDRRGRVGKLIQDRYSLRCLPQFLGPVIDTLAQTGRWIEVEANSANDNPLIDPDSGEIFHTGNFLAQYTGLAMDHMRHALGLLAGHVDAQIALIMSPEFNNGLSPSLVGDVTRGTNVGFKSLQIVGNSIAPLISFYGQSIVDRFPTHAEQFNQNINSQAMNAANLARDLLDVLEHYLSLALVCAIQAVELRAKLTADTFDARAVLSPATAPLYAAGRAAALGDPDGSRPLHWEDLEAFIQPKIEGVLANIAGRGSILRSISTLRESLEAFARG
jgi:phenylalanine ammonia-lyase